MSEEVTTVRGVIRAAIDTWLPEMLHPFGPLLFTPEDRHLNDLAERIERALSEATPQLVMPGQSLTAEDCEAIVKALQEHAPRRTLLLDGPATTITLYDHEYRELEALRAEVRRLPFWQVRTTTGEDLMVLVKEALLANKDFPAIAALLRSGGAQREE